MQKLQAWWARVCGLCLRATLSRRSHGRYLRSGLPAAMRVGRHCCGDFPSSTTVGKAAAVLRKSSEPSRAAPRPKNTMYRFGLLLAAALSGRLAGAAGAGPRPGFFARNVEISWVPKETVDGAADVGRGGPPRPTSPPAAAFGDMELVKRFPGYTMGSDTCGYIASYWGALLHGARRADPLARELTHLAQMSPSPACGSGRLVPTTAAISAAARAPAPAAIPSSRRRASRMRPRRPLPACAAPCRAA